MPTTTAPATIAATAADSLAADSVMVDSNALVTEPQYLSGFPDSASCDTVLPPLSALPVMTYPSGSPVVPPGSGPLRDTGSMALLLAGVLAVVVSYRTGYKYFENFLHNMFSTRRRENLFEDHTMPETRILSALMANTCIVEGLLLFYGVDNFAPSLSASLHCAVLEHVLLFTAVAAVFYVVQLAVYWLVGTVFADTVSARLWTTGFNATQSLLGLVLLPVLAIAMMVPDTAKQMLTIAIILYFCARIVFIYKGFRIFYGNLSSLIYFILYLCAAEIVPITVLCTSIVLLCQHMPIINT